MIEISLGSITEGQLGVNRERQRVHTKVCCQIAHWVRALEFNPMETFRGENRIFFKLSTDDLQTKVLVSSF